MPVFEDEKKAFDALDEELRKMNRRDQEDDLADILALLDKDYTKPRQEQQTPGNSQAGKFAAQKQPAATGHEDSETLRRSSQLQQEQPAQPPEKKKSRSWIPLAVVAVLELAAIAAVIVWWLQWLS